MRRGEWIGGAVLIAVSVIVAVGMWMGDPEHRAPTQLPTAAYPTPAGPPTLRMGSLLVTLPGLESRVDLEPAAVLCRPGTGAPARIDRAIRTTDGTLHLQVWVRRSCYGWTPATQVENYPRWLDDMEIGALIDL